MELTDTLPRNLNVSTGECRETYGTITVKQPLKTQKFQIRFTTEDHEILKALKKKTGLTQASVLRLAIRRLADMEGCHCQSSRVVTQGGTITADTDSVPSRTH